MIKAFILCKNDLFFKAIESLLSNAGIENVCYCKEPFKAVVLFEYSKADVVIMDINWEYHGYAGFEILAIFLSYDKNIKVICVTTFFQHCIIEKLKLAGARGYFFRSPAGPDKMNKCIKDVHNGIDHFIEQE
ncbi:MAG: response regulator transcription factor [Chitinophagaceae bacterium]|nr:response regulator transcription factor [Chitinophagaceae bacterium]